MRVGHFESFQKPRGRRTVESFHRYGQRSCRFYSQLQPLTVLHALVSHVVPRRLAGQTVLQDVLVRYRQTVLFGITQCSNVALRRNPSA